MATAPIPAAATAGSASTKKKTATKASGAGTKAKKPARRKNPKSTKPGTSSNQAIWNAARAAQLELAGSRNQAAARLSDPLWFRAEDCFTVEESAMAANAKLLPEQVKIVDTALAHNNLTRADVTPQAFACLLEQARRFALDVILDAQEYAVHASRTEIGKTDLLLANEMRPDHSLSVTTQLPKLNLLAQQINKVPLPPIPTQCYSGVLLPPKNHQLTARTFDVVSGAQVAQKMVQTAPSAPFKKGSKSKPSYGAARGRQIAVNLKEKEKKEETKVESQKPEGEGPAPMDLSPAPASVTPPSVSLPPGVSSAPAAIAPPAASLPPDASSTPAATTQPSASLLPDTSSTTAATAPPAASLPTAVSSTPATTATPADSLPPAASSTPSTTAPPAASLPPAVSSATAADIPPSASPPLDTTPVSAATAQPPASLPPDASPTPAAAAPSPASLPPGGMTESPKS